MGFLLLNFFSLKIFVYPQICTPKKTLGNIKYMSRLNINIFLACVEGNFHERTNRDQIKQYVTFSVNFAVTTRAKIKPTFFPVHISVVSYWIHQTKSRPTNFVLDQFIFFVHSGSYYFLRTKKSYQNMAKPC